MIRSTIAYQDELSKNNEQTRILTASLTELYQQHQKTIYRYLLVSTGNVQDAHDLTAQTFLAALENFGSYRGERPALH